MIWLTTFYLDWAYFIEVSLSEHAEAICSLGVDVTVQVVPSRSIIWLLTSFETVESRWQPVQWTVNQSQLHQDSRLRWHPVKWMVNHSFHNSLFGSIRQILGLRKINIITMNSKWTHRYSSLIMLWSWSKFKMFLHGLDRWFKQMTPNNIFPSTSNKDTRQLPMGAGHCQWGGYTDRNVCNIHGEVHLASHYRAMLPAHQKWSS